MYFHTNRFIRINTYNPNHNWSACTWTSWATHSIFRSLSLRIRVSSVEFIITRIKMNATLIIAIIYPSIGKLVRLETDRSQSNHNSNHKHKSVCSILSTFSDEINLIEIIRLEFILLKYNNESIFFSLFFARFLCLDLSCDDLNRGIMSEIFILMTWYVVTCNPTQKSKLFSTFGSTLRFSLSLLVHGIVLVKVSVRLHQFLWITNPM